MYENPTDSKAVGECKTANSYYQPSSSEFSDCTSSCTICQDHNCWFSVTYQDGSYIRGPLLTDSIQLSGLSTNALFGGIQRESPNFSVASCDGILGFSFSELDSRAGDSIFENIYENGDIDHNIFSMCLGERAGELFLGGYDPDLDAGPIYYVDMLSPFDYYRIEMKGISIGSFPLSLQFSNYPTIIDSGSSYIELSQDVWDAFVQVYQYQYAELPHVISSLNLFSGFCFTDINLRIYPTIVFSLANNVTLTIEPPQYLIPGVSVTGEECRTLAIKVSDNDRIILGDAFMQGYNIIFDRENYQIGFSYLQNCADKAFISSISEGNGINVELGVPFKLSVNVQYLISHDPVVGLIVEFFVSRGAASSKIAGAATNSEGIATFETYVTTNGTSIITALVPGSLSPVLEFTIHGSGEISASFDDYSTFYSSWKMENTSTFLYFLF